MELIYTSVPEGLKGKGRGFCTVAVTAGMSRHYMMKLEALSGYEFLFNLSDPKAHLNPVNYAHARMDMAQETFSILSRIGFAGADYSGRANKIAHHFMLSQSEQMVQGPAWMMAKMSNEIFRSQWQEQPCELASKSLSQLLRSERSSAGSAVNWQNLTGDSGWGGMLVKAYYENSKAPAYVIYEPGTDLLSLFVESISLMPEEERWSVGFSTYYTTLPAGCFYHWRGIVAGSSAVREIARFPNALVIDLTKSLPRAEANKYTQAARTGIGLQSERPVSKVLPDIGKTKSSVLELTDSQNSDSSNIAGIFDLTGDTFPIGKGKRFIPPQVVVSKNKPWLVLTACVLAVLVVLLAIPNINSLMNASQPTTASTSQPAWDKRLEGFAAVLEKMRTALTMLNTGNSQDRSKSIDEARTQYSIYLKDRKDSIVVSDDMVNAVNSMLDSIEGISKKSTLASATQSANGQGKDLSGKSPSDADKNKDGKKVKPKDDPPVSVVLIDDELATLDQSLNLKESDPTKEITFDVGQGFKIQKLPRELKDIRYILDENKNAFSVWVTERNKSGIGKGNETPILSCELVKTKEGKNQLKWKPTGNGNEYLRFLIIEVVDTNNKKKYLCGLERSSVNLVNMSLGFDTEGKPILSKSFSINDFIWPQLLKFQPNGQKTYDLYPLCSLKIDNRTNQASLVVTLSQDVQKKIKNITVLKQKINESQKQVVYNQKMLDKVISNVQINKLAQSYNTTIEELEDTLLQELDAEKNGKRSAEKIHHLETDLDLVKKYQINDLKNKIKAFKEKYDNGNAQLNSMQNEINDLFVKLCNVTIIDQWKNDILKIKLDYSPLK
jgi:hypothetical protein